jgi:hypothetical protein
MIKKIILSVIILGISAGLVYGGVYRTIARTETEEIANQSERNLSISQGLSEEGNQGQGKNRTSSSGGQQGGKNGSESDHVASEEESKDMVSFTGTVTQVNEDLLVILSEKGNEIVIENRAWWFATDAGFSAGMGDSIALNGFYEAVDKFEVSYIENLTKGLEVQIREVGGHPLWAGNGRGA